MTNDPYSGTQGFFSSRHAQALAVFLLALFYITQNVSAVFYQARGAASGQGVLALCALSVGAVLWGFVMHCLQTRKRWLLLKGGRWLRLGFLVMLLLPPVVCMVSFPLTGWSGTLFLNVFQPFLWSMQLSIAPLLFFRHTRPSCQPLFYGFALEGGHVCWALILPLAGVAGPDGMISFVGIEDRHLQFMHLTRCLSAVGFAVIAWRLIEIEAVISSDRSAILASKAAFPLYEADRPFPLKKFTLILMPFVACFTLNGMTGYLFFPRVVSRGLYPEYMHLTLVLLFPLVGFILAKRGDKAFLYLTCGAVISAAVFPSLLALYESPLIRHLVYLACAATMQVLLFCGVLAMARFAYWSRFPVLIISTVWLSLVVAVPANVLAVKGLPLLGLSPSAGVYVLAAFCVISILPLCRSFPLPPYPCHSSTKGEQMEQGECVASLPKLAAFGLAFGLSAREVEVLGYIARHRKPDAIAVEMGITERTVRFHQTGLFRKTGQRNAHRLAMYYATWTPEQDV